VPVECQKLGRAVDCGWQLFCFVAVEFTKLKNYSNARFDMSRSKKTCFLIRAYKNAPWLFEPWGCLLFICFRKCIFNALKQVSVNLFQFINCLEQISMRIGVISSQTDFRVLFVT